MSTRYLARQLVRSNILRASLYRPQLVVPPRPSPLFFTSSYATGQVSNQPGSKDFKELGQNAKEEMGTLAKDAVGAIMGANDKTAQGAASNEPVVEGIKKELDSVTSVAEKIPQGALVFGGAGLLPYAGAALTTIYLSRAAGLADAGVEGPFDAETALALLHHVETLQVGYGALILSFLGALHWGFEFAGFGGTKGSARYLLGIAPVMAGWGSLLLPGQIALIAQWFAFTGMWYADQRATTMGWTPRWYSTYRFGLTAFVGSAIIVTLAGANYFGPGTNAFRTTGKRLADVKETEVGDSFRSGDLKVEASQDAFVMIRNVKREEEEAKKEAEEKKKAELKARKEARTGIKE